jgi:hypothetical protein
VDSLDRRAAFVAEAFWRPFWEAPPSPIGPFDPTPAELQWRTPGDIPCPDGGTASVETTAILPDAPAPGDRYTRRFTGCAWTTRGFPAGTFTTIYDGAVDYEVTSFSGSYPDFTWSAEIDASGLVTTMDGVAGMMEGSFGLVAVRPFQQRTLVADQLRVVAADGRETYRWSNVSVSGGSGWIAEGDLEAEVIGGRVGVKTVVPWTVGSFNAPSTSEVMVTGAGSTMRIRWGDWLQLALDLDTDADGSIDQTVTVSLLPASP